jgi:hypothetical protein
VQIYENDCLFHLNTVSAALYLLSMIGKLIDCCKSLIYRCPNKGFLNQETAAEELISGSDVAPVSFRYFYDLLLRQTDTCASTWDMLFCSQCFLTSVT